MDNMNILSFINRPIHGSEIKQWIIKNTKENTEYSHIAKNMLRYMNLADNRLYIIITLPSGTGCGEKKKYKPNIVRA